MPRTLAIDCATEACSVALFEDNRLIAFDHKVLGRGHAERLVPMIAGLPAKGKADAILVSRGPGSFTGVRIGIATARALAFAWGASIQAYPTLASVAALARAEKGDIPALVCMTGGHGEWFIQEFGQDGQPMADHAALTPKDAAALFQTELVVGTQSEAFTELRGWGTAIVTTADARKALSIPRELLSDDVSPLYGRAPDAKLPK